MQIYHKVEDGESLSSLALAYGLAQDTIWQDAANAKLRANRSRADALLTGDLVAIPVRREKVVTYALNARHVFRRIGVPIIFELRLFDGGGKPLADCAYVLEVDGKVHTGRTDRTGLLKQTIPNDARVGRIKIENEVDRQLLFGWLDPIETLSGVQKRLSNLGFVCTQDRGIVGRATYIALMRFQRAVGLPPTGDLDERTREEVRACHDVVGHYESVLQRGA